MCGTQSCGYSPTSWRYLDFLVMILDWLGRNGSCASAHGCTWRTSSVLMISRSSFQLRLPSSQRWTRHGRSNFPIECLRLMQKHMRKMHENPKAIDVTTMPGVLEMFKTSNQVLDEVQKSLEAYLETKRAAFARFYFLSNDELLQILSVSAATDLNVADNANRRPGTHWLSSLTWASALMQSNPSTSRGIADCE